MVTAPENAVLDAQVKQRIDELLAENLEAKLLHFKEHKKPSIVVLATGGTLGTGYLPFILSATAAALGWDASVFFTFYGLQLLKKDLGDLKVSPLGNPAMLLTSPFGPEWLRKINCARPNACYALIPGFEAMATSLMKRNLKDNGVASLTELRDLCVHSGVHLVACQMTVRLLGFTPDDFIPEVTEYAGAAAFLPRARKADVSLFM